MRDQFDTHLDILPLAQQQVWPELAPAPDLGFVLYGGTAVALHLGHRTSVDFDFFKAEPLDKAKISSALRFMRDAQPLQEDVNSLIVDAVAPAGRVKVSFFGGLALGRINDPLQTRDRVLLVASLEDLLATKLEAILDRAEAKDYRDIAAMLLAGVSLERALGGFAAMFRSDAALPLKALGFFKDGDLPSLSQDDRDVLCRARDGLCEIGRINLQAGLLPKSDA
ncbi:nucleotidyl transferase AbiEii/AbiGii toxin family protein [Bradyrhizobium oligotrophicum]|uniref:nucleotidyl transferase AbiEii/AbiGii toxin family protein n=1 Tax=Bradyrhizobium oligotrophicum TaxID=44255 RepID=UPI003EBFF562